MRKIFLALLSLILSGCHGYPKAVTPVKDFDIGRYLGKWYEIARLDHSFERGLEQVTAEYTLQDNGQVKVVNRGFSRNTMSGKKRLVKPILAERQTRAILKSHFSGHFTVRT